MKPKTSLSWVGFWLCALCWCNAEGRAGSLLTPEQLNGAPWYHSLEAALEDPDHVYKLDLSHQGLTEVPEALFSLPQLHMLMLNGNRISALPDRFAELGVLADLELNGNAFREFPMVLLQMRVLNELEISENQLTALPHEIDQLQSLVELEARNNRLRDLPDSLSRLKQLEELKVDGNQISSLSAELFELPGLLEVTIRENRIRKLPSTVGKCYSLKELDVSGNQLVDLPDELFGLNLDICYVWQEDLERLSPDQARWLIDRPFNDYERIVLRHAEAGRVADAIYYFDLLEEAASDDEPSRRALALLVGAKVYRFLRDIEQASRYSREAVELLAATVSEASSGETQASESLSMLADRLAEARTLLALSEAEFLKARLSSAVRWVSAAVVATLVTFILFVLWSRRRLQRAHRLVSTQKTTIELQASDLVDINQRLRQQHEEVISQKKEIEEQAEVLERLNRTKDRLFSIIGHDLRNPLAAMEGLAGVLAADAGNLTSQQIEEYALMIEQSTVELRVMLDNLLQWSRAQTEGIDFVPEFFPVEAVLKEVESLNRATAQVKKIRLEVETEPDLFVYADRNMLLVTLRNLVSNALKFTSSGGTVWVEAGQRGDAIEVAVRDSGVGMRPEQIANLFRPEAAESLQGTAGEKGSGLGLLLVGEFVTRNNGKIEVSSEAGKGSRFVVSLPRWAMRAGAYEHARALL